MYCNASATDRVRWRSHLWQCGQAHFHKRLKFKMCIHLFKLCVCNPGPGEAQESTGFLFFYLKIGKPVQTQWSGWGELTSLFYWTVKYWVPLKTSTPCSTPPFRIKLQNSITDPPQYPVKHGLVSAKYRCVIRVSERSQSINSCDNKMVCNQFLASCFIYLLISKKTFLMVLNNARAGLCHPRIFYEQNIYTN